MRAVWATALPELSQQLVWATCSCLVNKAIYRTAQVRELQQNGMRLTPPAFFIMVKLYIRHVTESFIRRNVIAPSPMGLQLYSDSDLPYATCKSSNLGQMWVCSCLCRTDILANFAQGQAESLTAPTPFTQQPFLCHSQGNITASKVYGLIGSNGKKIRVWDLHKCPPAGPLRCPLMTAIIHNAEQCWWISMCGKEGGREVMSALKSNNSGAPWNQWERNLTVTG